MLKPTQPFFKSLVFILLISGLISIPSDLSAQADHQIYDSLLNVLNTDISDRERVDTYLAIGEQLKNADRNSIGKFTTPAIELAKSINYQEALAQAYYLHGAQFTFSFQMDSLYAYMDSALTFANQYENYQQVANVYSVIGFNKSNEGKFDEAKAYQLKALHLRDSIQDYAGLLTSYINLGELYNRTSANRDAYLYLQKGFALLDKVDYTPPHLYNIMSNVYVAMGNMDSAIYCIEKVQEIATEAHNIQQLAGSYLALGMIYQQFGKSVDALEMYMKAHDGFKEVNAHNDLNNVYQNIGILQYGMNNIEGAISSFKNGLDLSLQTGDLSGATYNANNIGYVLLYNGQIDEAKDYLDRALKYAQEVNSTGELCTIYETLSEYYIAIDDSKTAISYILKSNDLIRESDDKDGIAQNLTIMAGLYLQHGEYRKGIKLLKESMKLSEAIDSKPRIKENARMLAKAYAAINEGMKAYEAHVLYKAMSDSIQDIEKTRRFTKIEADFEFQQERDSIAYAQEKERLTFNAQLEKEQTRQRMTLMGFVAVGLIAIILGVFFYQNKKKNTELARLNQEVQNQNIEIKAQRDHLEDLNNTKSKFFSIISHDLRSPMSSFQALSDVIDFHLEEQNYDELKEITQEVVKRSKEINQLLDNLLNWAVEEQGEFPFHPEETDVKPVLDEVIALYQPLSAYKDITLKLEVAEEQQNVFADKNCLTTILRNLISNAIKFTKTGGTITIRTFSAGEPYLNFEITDSGLGMPKEKADQIFRSGQLQSTKGTSGEKGVGLGLQLVRDFVAMNAGTAKVESLEGKGTTFTISLPVHKELQEA